MRISPKTHGNGSRAWRREKRRAIASGRSPRRITTNSRPAARAAARGQWDIWAAVFGPQGRDGYPAPIWDKQSGVIDHNVAAHWKTHFDLTSIVTSNWSALGPKLAARTHFYVGSEDTFFLNNAVELFERATGKLDSPPAHFQFIYGLGQPHDWYPVSMPDMFTTMADFVARQAPAGTDTSGWRGTQQPAALMLTPVGRSSTGAW